MVTPKGRMNPQPSGMTVPDESFRVDPSHFPRPQELDPWVPMMPFYGYQPEGSFSWMPQSWQSEVADVPTQEWTPYSGISRLISGQGSPWDVAEAALDTTDFLPSGGPVGDLLGLGAKGIGKVASAIPWSDVASFAGKAIPEGTLAGLAGMFASSKKNLMANHPPLQDVGGISFSKNDAEFFQHNPYVEAKINYPENIEYIESQRKWLEGETQSQTAGFRMYPVPVNDVKNLPGAAGEHLVTGENLKLREATIQEIADNIKEQGWQGPPIMVFIKHDGVAEIWEGNHRIKAAEKAGMKFIPTEIKYLGGSEEIPNVWGEKFFRPPQGTGGVLPGSSANKPAYRTDFVNPDRVHGEHLTGWFRDDVQVDINDLKDLPGARGEHLRRETEVSKKHIKTLTESMEKDGWTGGSVMVYVEMDGSAILGEGNHRVQAALNAGITEIPTEIRYFGNSNQNPDVWGKKYIDQGLPPQGTGGVLP